MNNKAVVPLIILSMYIALFAGLTIANLGKPSSGEIYITDLWLVIEIVSFISLPAWLGFEIGKNLNM